MKPPVRLAVTAGLAILALGSETPEMRHELKVDPANFAILRARFGTYGYRARQTIFLDTSGLRFRLPGGVPGVGQTGLYSYFALAGDCEVTITYELLNVPPPRTGYGSGIGLAFDIEGGAGRGTIQRVFRVGDGSGCVLQTAPVESGGGMKEVDRFVPATSRRGRIGLRRVKNQLIFLSADAPSDALQEIDRLPFTDRTIRAVRVFADAGGSPTAVEIRVRQIDLRAEEIASGVPQSEPRQWRWAWLWAVVPAAGGALLFWAWRVHRVKTRRAGSVRSRSYSSPRWRSSVP
jgi:hypothetical protein